MNKKILFLSNGHGEDLNASLIIKSLATDSLKIAALPIVGDGKAYLDLGVPIIAPTANLPSGGIVYTNPLNWVKDIANGLIALTLGQIKAVFNYSRDCDLLVAVGDIVPISIAWLTRRPFVAFIVSTSSYYEGRLRLPLITRLALESDRCVQVFTRDAFTARDLQKRGLDKAVFAGYPIMDVLTPSGRDLELKPDIPVIALLPGSRLPEALDNLSLQLCLCEEAAKLQPLQFCIALVAGIDEGALKDSGMKQGWQYHGEGKLVKNGVMVRGYWGAFPDILQSCDAVVGMAGTAVEQAVGLGKPVLQIPGSGPQFTYPFAEAQMRLLGDSVVTIDRKPKTPAMFTRGAGVLQRFLRDSNYRELCSCNGLERVGEPGGSSAIAGILLRIVNS
ncbi:MAG: hypothetical protein N5P05_000831 [Chroococcopsis gigantea SAG 12.99]|jgi:uncharacterized protein (TIGR03492 family)|nr:lipid-A-disaccharide synthase-related protein [Chlorogloea purpurea SAG 13.99]MDV2999225.1 hypothetical protein [Chroococcopsis gigantea SAG 12.99]